MEETPIKSVRRMLSENNLNISKSSVHRILIYDLKKTPFKMAVMQHLKPSDKAARRTFASWLKDNDGIVESVWFTDEAHFTLDGQVNKQNVRYWSNEKPGVFQEKALHSEKVTAWIALSSSGIIGPYFYEVGGETATVTSDRYLHILSNRFLPELERRGIHALDIYFQQDGAAPHTANRVLQETFEGNLIALKTEIEWPLHSPDLNPLDFFCMGIS